MNHPITYLIVWSSCLVIAAVLFIRKKNLKKNLSDYRAFLSEPWKIATFIIATAGITLAAPYTGDPTWDYPDSIVMSVMTFVSAPWAVGALYCSLRTGSGWTDVYIALCLMFFSSSWCYDAYILVRDGVYPPTWFSNLIISPCLYIAGGLFWNLEHVPGKGVIFSFQRGTWYHEKSGTSFRRVIWIAMPLMAFTAYAVGWFVLNR